MQPDPLPLHFLHVAKTGGTSFTAALARYYRPDDIISDNGHLSLAFVDRQRHRLSEPVFLHGHPIDAVMTVLGETTRTITLLRRPADHAVSNYLHIAHSEDGRMHKAAAALGFLPFMRIYNKLLAFQTVSLNRSAGGRPVVFEKDLDAALERVLDLLDNVTFALCLEDLQRSAPLLSAHLGLPSRISYPHLNTSSERNVRRDRIDALREQYESLRHDRTTARFIAIEEAVYAKAASLLVGYENSLVRQVSLRDIDRAPSARIAYRGQGGCAILGDNWGAAVQTADGPAWWSGEDELSTLLVSLEGDANTLTARVFVNNFAEEIRFSSGSTEITYETTSDTQGFLRLRLDLTPLGRRGVVSMRIGRGRAAPNVEPFYPAVALGEFTLVKR
jgi:hypothetical protein